MLFARCPRFNRMLSNTETILSQRLYCGMEGNTANFNYYDALGIKNSSTQSEIKSAYYKLSMQYHPDKNQGCEISAKKFREITQAYEVLGNYRLRKLYDKGIIHTAGSQFRSAGMHPSHAHVEEEDDPETKFYKSRFRRSKVADVSGRTPIYDFDEWSRAHYGKSFERRKAAKAQWEYNMAVDNKILESRKTEQLLVLIVFISVVLASLLGTDNAFDNPKNLAAKKERLEREKLLAEKKALEEATSNSPTT